MNTVLMQKLCCIFATLWGIFTPLIKPRAVCYYACFGESIIQIPGTFDISTDRQLLLWCVGSFAVWDLYVTSSSRCVFLVFIKLKNAIKRVTITQQRSYLRWSWKFYDTVATATFDWNGKTQPTAEALHVLQLKHSGAHKVLRPGLFDLRHRFEAAEVKLLFQNLTETRVLHWFTAHPLQVALAIAGLARHGINKLGQAASGEPNTEFHSLNVLPLMTLTKVLRMGSQSQPTLCAQTVLKLHNLQLANWRFWKIDRTSSGIERRHCSCFRVQMHKPLVHQWGNRGNFSWCFLEILTIS